MDICSHLMFIKCNLQLICYIIIPNLAVPIITEVKNNYLHLGQTVTQLCIQDIIVASSRRSIKEDFLSTISDFGKLVKKRARRMLNFSY